MNEILQTIILGIVQGLTEFIPVSSSGHLTILPRLFDWPEQATALDAFLHLGTLSALMISFRYDIFSILTKWKKPKNKETLINISLTSIPTLSFAALIFFLEPEFIKSNSVIIFMLIAIGIIFIIIDFKLPMKNTKATKKETSKKAPTRKDALLLGFAQSLALLRGSSRSGVVIIGSRFAGLKMQDSIRYSFLAGIPVIAIAGLVSLVEIISQKELNINVLVLVAGYISSFISGLIAIKFMLKFTNRFGLKWFGIYRITLAIIIIISL